MSYSPTLIGQFSYTAGDIGGPHYNLPTGAGSIGTISIPITQDVPAGSVLFVGFVRQIEAGGTFGAPQIGSQAFGLTVGSATNNPLVAAADYPAGTLVTISTDRLIYGVVEVYLLNGFEGGFQVGGTPPNGLGLYYNIVGMQADVLGNMPGDPIGHTETDAAAATLIAAGTKVSGVAPSQSTRYKDTYRFIRFEDSDTSHNWALVSSSLTLNGTQFSSLGITGMTLRIYPTITTPTGLSTDILWPRNQKIVVQPVGSNLSVVEYLLNSLGKWASQGVRHTISAATTPNVYAVREHPARAYQNSYSLVYDVSGSIKSAFYRKELGVYDVQTVAAGTIPCHVMDRLGRKIVVLWSGGWKVSVGTLGSDGKTWTFSTPVSMGLSAAQSSATLLVLPNNYLEFTYSDTGGTTRIVVCKLLSSAGVGAWS